MPSVETFAHMGERQSEILEFGPTTRNLLAADPSPNVAAILVAWTSDGSLDWADAADAVASVDADSFADPFPIRFEMTGDSFWAHRVPVPGPHFDVPASGTFVLEGDFQLYLFNVDYVLSDAEGDHLFSTGFPKETTTEGRVEKNVLTVTDGVLRVAAPEARLRAPSFTAALDGALGLEDATGYFDAGDTRYEATRLPAVLEGAFNLHAEAVASGGDDPVAFLTLDGDLRKASLAPRDAPRGVLPTPAKVAAWAGVVAIVASLVLLLLKAGLAQYSRLHADQLLDLPVRRKLVETAAQFPGLPKRELCRRVGCAWGSGLQELDRLERAGLVRYVRAGRYVLVYPPDGEPLPLSPATRRVLEALPRESPVLIRDLADSLSLRRQTVAYHVSALDRAGMVEASRGKVRIKTTGESG